MRCWHAQRDCGSLGAAVAYIEASERVWEYVDTWRVQA